MIRLTRPLVAVALAALLIAAAAAAAQGQDVSAGASEPPAVAFSPDRVIVEWAAGASPGERRAAREEADVDFARDLGNRRFQLVETEPGQQPREAVLELEADPAVILAERDAYDAPDATPNDPLFGRLWGLRNTGLGVAGFPGAVAGADIDAAGAWERTVGAPSTVVAVIDSGYRFEHPDLADVVWTNPGEAGGAPGIDDDGNGIVDDLHGADFVSGELPAVDGDPTDDDLFEGGHGVHVAGTIGAEGNDGVGITGVAQNVRIMPLRVCGREEAGCPHSAQIEAINYAGAKGARVANISLGGETNTAARADAIALNPQTLFVVSAGNEASNNDAAPRYPCNHDPVAEGKGAVDNVVCVAATDQADRLAWFSDWGQKSVDLGAPGTETLSAFPTGSVVEDDFEIDDFASKWSATGPDGGFGRTGELPLTSFGISDSPGAPPVAGSIVESTSAPIPLPPGHEECDLEFSSEVSGSSHLWVEAYLGEEMLVGLGTKRDEPHSISLSDRLSPGGNLTLRFRYEAGSTPSSSDGAWVDDVAVRCIALVGGADGYAFLQGTSMATPHVTGAAALLFSLKPSASVGEVRRGLLGSVDPLPSLAGKTASGGRLDASAAVDLFDAVPPPVPVLSATNPPSPAKANQPRLLGMAQRGSSVDVYANATCTGPAVAAGTAAQLAGPGIAVAVPDESVSHFSVRATDLVPLASACSEPISYTEDSDLVPPPAPRLLSTDPPSPGTSATPRILGDSEAGSAVSLYAGPACLGAPVTTGSAAELGSPGILVHVAEGVTAVFSATAVDAGGNTSACSPPISYARLGAAADPGIGDPAPPAPACTVPRLAGKTLARAKRALKAAGCRLGAVRKARSRKGVKRRAFVVRSSNPRAGARPAGGRVDLRLGPKPRKAS